MKIKLKLATTALGEPKLKNSIIMFFDFTTNYLLQATS